ncbi:MAG: CDP-alcohol phosphatidyltransferase family protein [Pseudomonadota bacterium]
MRFAFVNALTGLSACFGLLLILQADHLTLGQIHVIFAACVLLDGMDGYFARRWQVETTFGKLADCVADFLVFGVALAFVLGRFDVPQQFQVLWILAAALRLYYFQTVPPSPHVFAGLPLPAAALSVLGVLVLRDSGTWLSVPMAHVSIIAIAAVMFSTIAYPKQIAPFAIAAALALPLAILTNPAMTAFVTYVGLCYLLLGLGSEIRRVWQTV